MEGRWDGEANKKLITVTWPVHVPPICLEYALGTRVGAMRVDSAEVLMKTVGGCGPLGAGLGALVGRGGSMVCVCVCAKSNACPVPPCRAPSLQVLPMLQAQVPNFNNDLMIFNTGCAGCGGCVVASPPCCRCLPVPCVVCCQEGWSCLRDAGEATPASTRPPHPRPQPALRAAG